MCEHISLNWIEPKPGATWQKGPSRDLLFPKKQHLSRTKDVTQNPTNQPLVEQRGEFNLTWLG
jgi:hypothetical protein